MVYAYLLDWEQFQTDTVQWGRPFVSVIVKSSVIGLKHLVDLAEKKVKRVPGRGGDTDIRGGSSTYEITEYTLFNICSFWSGEWQWMQGSSQTHVAFERIVKIDVVFCCLFAWSENKGKLEEIWQLVIKATSKFPDKIFWRTCRFHLQIALNCGKKWRNLPWRFWPSPFW